MTNSWIDISMPLFEEMTVWPSFDGPTLRRVREFEDGHRSISSIFTSNVHNGTHVDAPLHFVPDGDPIETLELDPFIGPAVVVDATDADQITADVLSKIVPSGTERVLLKTANSLRRSSQVGFDEKFVALTTDATEWIVENGIRLIGNDYPSIGVYKGDSEIHLGLMRANVGILEGLVLDNVEPGNYELVCLPLLIKGADGAPARAVIRPI